MIRLNLLHALPRAPLPTRRAWHRLALPVLLGVMVGAHLWQARQLHHLGAVQASLEAQAREIARRVDDVHRRARTSAEVARRRDLVERLRRDRDRTVHILHDLETLLPQQLWLSEVEFGPQGLQLTGAAADTGPVMNLLHELRRLAGGGVVDLLELRLMADAHYQFKAAARPPGPGAEPATPAHHDPAAAKS